MVAMAAALPNNIDRRRHRRQPSSPCLDLASAQEDFLTRNPGAAVAILPANITYACLTSVPVQKNFSTRLVKGVRAWFEFQSDVDYIANPPSGSLWQPTDTLGYLDVIANDISNDMYENQYDVEVDLFTFALHFHDFHTIILPGLFGAGRFDRNLTLVSYSKDGIDMPKVFIAHEVFEVTSAGLDVRSDIEEVSPIASINGFPVQDFLQTQSLVAFSHDPDAMYNQMLLSIPLTFNPQGVRPNSFRYPMFYPGAATTVELEDGTIFNTPALSQVSFACDLSGITSDEDFWQKCIYEPEEATAIETAAGVAAALSAAFSTAGSDEHTTESRSKHRQLRTRAEPDQSDTKVQLFGHPLPEYIDQDYLLSGYYLADHEDVAVLVIRSFFGQSSGYVDSFQDTLASFLEDAKTRQKTKLIIDIQGNGGGFVDLGTELVAQLFPGDSPNQKGNMRASLALRLLLEKESHILDYLNQQAMSTDDVLINEGKLNFAWESLMDPDGNGFSSFADFYGPNRLGENGNYTNFFQSNYTNTDPTELNQQRIQITGFGSKPLPPEIPPPFEASNIVLLSDGFCGSTCSNVLEILTNLHSVPSIAVQGRPSTGPMQTVGNTKGSLSFSMTQLLSFLTFWLDDTLDPIDLTQVDDTVFEHLELFGLAHGVTNLNGKNNYRIGDDTETPLQMVYTAADCKIWPTLDMIVDQSQLWRRVADIAFDTTREQLGAGGGPFANKYCVKDSTGHSTSVTGGLETGKLGDQNPPASAYPKHSGWLKEGRELVQGFSLVRTDSTGPSAPRLSNEEVKIGLANLKTACSGYSGNKWLFTLLCGVFG